jgi:serine phosphatase RsbU (regulator of sigma subunit)
MIHTLNALVLSILLLTASGAVAQHRIAPHITNFSPEDYNAHNQNWAFLQDHRGVLYVANGDGVLEYDGLGWNTITTSVKSTVLSLALDSSGRVYVGGIGDIGYLAPNEGGITEFHTLTHLLPDTLKASLGNVWNTHVIGEKHFFRTVEELIIIEGDSVLIIPAENKFHRSFVVDGEVWILDTNVGFSVYDKGQLFPLRRVQALNAAGVYAVLPYYNGHYLIVTSNAGLFIAGKEYDEPAPFASQYHDFLINARVYCATALSEDRFAVGTYKAGILIFDKRGMLIQKISRREGLISEDLNVLFYDKHHQLWCGLNSGISRVSDESPISSLHEGEDYSGVVNGMAVAGDDMYIASTQTVFRMQEPNLLADTVEKLIRPVRDLDAQCFDLVALNETELLAASANGLFHIRGLQAERINTEYSRVITLVKGSPEIAVSSGRDRMLVHRFSGGKWTELAAVEGLPDEALSVQHDPTRTDSAVFWMGMFSYGIAKVSFSLDWKSHTISLYDSPSGVPDRWTQAFLIDNEVRFGTDGQGIYRHDAATNRMVPDEESGLSILKDQSLFILKQSPDGRIYLDAGGEIWVLNPIESGGYEIDSSTFAALDIGEVNVIVSQHEGERMWLAGVAGIASYRPGEGPRDAVPYETLIRQVQIGLDSSIFEGNFSAGEHVLKVQSAISVPQVDYEFNALSFRFSAASFGYHERMLYCYKLDGKDDHYSEWSLSTEARFVNLREGEYTFKVKARNIFGNESEVANYRFVVWPPWYRTWWAYVLFAVAGVVIILVSKKLRDAQKVKAHNEFLEEEVRVRTAEIRQQHDSIVEQKAIIEQKNKGIVDSIRYAKRIQEAILPSSSFMREQLPPHFLLYMPRDIVSGDFYWFHAKDDAVFIAVADCTGHGVPGAFLSMMCHNLLSEAVIEADIDDPAEILTAVNRNLQSRLALGASERRIQDGMDIALCRLDKDFRKLQFAGAKNPFLLMRGEEQIMIKGDRSAIGGYSKVGNTYTAHTVDLQKDDVFFLYSDGFQDQFGGQEGKKFLVKRFKELLALVATLNIEEGEQLLEKKFAEWKGNHEQIDDVCIVGIRI